MHNQNQPTIFVTSLNETTTHMIPNTIKVGRVTYEIQKGDYILYNGIIYQFCSGDGRTLKRERFYSYSNVTVPNSTLKKIPLELLTKKEFQLHGQTLTKWIF